jgi:CTP:molybdopterin cytidylyltransferase MocA
MALIHCTPSPAPVGGVVLGAGESRRFGRPKLTLQYGGVPFIRRAVDAAAEAGCADIVSRGRTGNG